MAGEHDDAPSNALATPVILDMCDRALGEVGRRRHVFTWLRAPSSGADDWLPVDAYYPADRLVVLVRDTPAERRDPYRVEVPAHGLRLLELSSRDLGGDAAAAAAVLRRLIDALALSARAGGPDGNGGGAGSGAVQGARSRALARVATSLSQAAAQAVAPPAPAAQAVAPPAPAAQAVSAPAPAVVDLSGPDQPRRLTARERGARHVERLGAQRARRTAPGPPTPRPGEPAATEILAGLLTAAIVCVEVYFGVWRLAVRGDHWLLAFGIALDAVARALGAVAMRRARRPGWSWWCAVLGSPAVAWLVLFEDEEPLSVPPAPIAGLFALLALGLIVSAVVLDALGL